MAEGPALRHGYYWEKTMTVPERDKSILRRLAAQWAEIAASPIHEERAGMWGRLNRLERVKPMVLIDEIPWHEMNVDDELTLLTRDPFYRTQERQLRRTIYKWRHMPCDMTVAPFFCCPLVVHDTGFGIDEIVDIAKTDETSDVVSRRFHLQIQDEDDLLKIQMPQVTYDAEATEQNYQRLVDLFGDILPIEKTGAPGFWFAPWDELIRWWGVQEAMMDLIMRPSLVHQAMDRLVSAYLYRLDQYEAQNLLALNNTGRNNIRTRIGSGGLGYTDELPQPAYDPQHARAIDLWGCATAQIFSDVSPAMHEEFALQYERRWLERFGLTYYGCCEPLHLKIDMLKSVSNLRKVSMSPWVDMDIAVKNVGDRNVFSRKPNPAIFAEDVWNLARARESLRRDLEKARGGCVVEVIMKDISTVRYRPQRLWEWAEMAMEVTAEFA